MRYRSIAPGPDLAPWVECFWSLAGDGPSAGAPEAVWPDGCMELIVHLGDPFRSLADDGALAIQPTSLLVGQLLRPMLLQPGRRVATLGIRFRPGGARPFFGVPLGELAGAVIPLETLWGADARRFESDLASAHAGSMRRRVSAGTLERRAPGQLALERAASLARHTLLRRLDSRRGPSAEVSAAIGRVIEARGAMRIDRLAREVGWGSRRLERRFLAAVGLPPKPFARIVRFQSLLARLPARDPDWVTLALDCGYFDQSHLAGEVRALAGATPSALAQAGASLAAVFTTRDRLARYFAG